MGKSSCGDAGQGQAFPGVTDGVCANVRPSTLRREGITENHMILAAVGFNGGSGR